MPSLYSGPQFYSYFVHCKAHEVCYTMRKNVGEAAGLGSPPGIFTTNASESIKPYSNAKLTTRSLSGQHEVKQLAKPQREEVIRSLSNHVQ